MEEFEFVVTLRVKVDAFSPLDAAEVVEDTFGIGSEPGVEVVSFEYEPSNH